MKPCIAMLLLISLTSAASAQSRTLESRVRIAIKPFGQITGTLLSWSPDSLVLDTGHSGVRGVAVTEVKRLEIAGPRSRPHAAARHALVAGAIGGVLGMALSRRSGTDAVETLYAVWFIGMRVAPLGAAIGLIAPGERWTELALPARDERGLETAQDEAWRYTMLRFEPSDPLRLNLNNGQTLTGMFHTVRGDQIELLTTDTVQVRAADVNAVWKGERSTSEGIVIGGLAGCLTGHLVFSLERRVSQSGASAGYDFLACGGGGALGMLLGGIVGAGTTKWVRQLW